LSTGAGRAAAQRADDYRLERLGGMATWHAPIGEEATAQVREAFFRLTDYPPEDAAHVPSPSSMSAAGA
jgi:predicted ATPase